MDKDCELQKIDTFRSYLEANVNTQFTFLAGGLIGILVLFISLFYEGIFDVFGGRFLGLIPFVVVLVGVFYTFNRILRSIKDQETRYLSLIFDLISKVEKGEQTPSLSELKLKVTKRNKT